MSLTKVRIRSVVVGDGPVPSLVVLAPIEGEKRLELPIRIGSVEATTISMGVDPSPGSRPLAHDLLLSSLSALGATLDGVRVMSVSGTTFFAQLDLVDAAGVHHYIDARPSDALALAVRCGCDIWASDEVLRTAALPDFRAVEDAEMQAELAEFRNFMDGVTPEDFSL